MLILKEDFDRLSVSEDISSHSCGDPASSHLVVCQTNADKTKMNLLSKSDGTWKSKKQATVDEGQCVSCFITG